MSSQFSMANLQSATDNFSPDMIIGGCSERGLIYKAQLSNGLTVAIKTFPCNEVLGSSRQFRAEAETLGKLRHPNIIKLFGYQASGSGAVLVYEFIEGRDLYSWLYFNLSELTLSWVTRLKIVKGVANGLSYLHGLDSPIIHRDIKSKNVLLDSDFEAHICQFGLSRSIDPGHSHVSTIAAGSMGYMPPEYKEGFTVATRKADVYSFGVLMLEIATGRRPNLPTKFDGKEMGVVEWARKMVAQNRLFEMVDSSVSKEDLVEANVKEYFNIACLCAYEISRERPPMREVIELLNRLST